jgi:hypothetical protein
MLGRYHVTATSWAAASLVLTFALFLLSLFMVFPDAALKKMCGLLLFAIAYRPWGRQLGMALFFTSSVPRSIGAFRLKMSMCF